jgi:hypothetical protein
MQLFLTVSKYGGEGEKVSMGRYRKNIKTKHSEICIKDSQQENGVCLKENLA